MLEIVNLSKISKVLRNWKKSLVPIVALAVGVAASLGLSSGDDVQDSDQMPGVSDEQQSIEQIDSNIDQTKKKLEQLEASSDDSNDNDYALMGC